MNTIESWENFTRYYGGIVGARDCFELVCEELLRNENPTCEVHRVKANRGDGGIDVYVEKDEIVQIYQCKFFLEPITPSRWQQIEKSFLRLIELKDISVNEWFLCVPKEFTKEDLIEIQKFKMKYSSYGIKIWFIDGNELISRMKKVNIDEKWFSPVEKRCLHVNASKICPEYIERDEIEKLKSIILDKKQNILLSGIGGIGKTTLAEKLYDEVSYLFDVSIWITYKENLVSSVATALAEKKVDNDVMLCLERMLNSKTNQRNIVFVDDIVENYLTDKHREILERNSLVVATSRMETISGYITYEVEALSDSKCIELFAKYYKRPISKTVEKKIFELVNRFDKNTMLTELVARAAYKSVKNLNDFIESLLNLGISSTEIKVQNAKEKTYAKISEHLISLYSLENIGEEKKRILINFTLSKERGVTDRFIQIINASEEDIGDLIEFGWIKRTSCGLSMHSLIRESINNQIDTFDGVINNLIEFYTDREFYQDEYTIMEKDMHFDIILNLLRVMKFKNENDVYILYNLIQLIDFFAYYDSLDDVVGLAVQELEKFEESEVRGRVGCDIFNAAGLAYLSYDKGKAIVSFLCEKQLIDKFFSDKDKVNAIWRCNMALAYIGENFEKANQLLNESLDIEIQCYGENSEPVADVYHNIGKNYLSVQDYISAKCFFEKALHIKTSIGRCTYSLIKTEFALANTLNFLLQEPFEKDDIERIRKLYISVLERYRELNNISNYEYYNTINIIADFLDKIGEVDGAVKLRELI